MKTLQITAGLVLAMNFSGASLRAETGTWKQQPLNGDWNTAANWTNGTIPNSSEAVAKFARSNQTEVSLSATIDIRQVIFSADASAYTIICSPGQGMDFDAASDSHSGIINQSGVSQNFLVMADSSGLGGYLQIGQTAGAGDQTIFTTYAAGIHQGGTGIIFLADHATAQTAQFMNRGGSVTGALGGETALIHFTTAASATFSNEAASADGAGGGATVFDFTASGGSALITSEGARVAGAGGGITLFEGHSDAAGATLIAQGGSNGGQGGEIIFQDNSSGSAAQLELTGNAALDISEHESGVGIGSLEGAGVVYLGSNNLAIGSNGLNTAFAGALQDKGGGADGTGGSINKTGSGTLTLTGLSTYTGGTAVEGGTLLVNTGKGSATGSGPVQVNAGTFGGRSNITGAVTIGSGSGTGAFLAPGINGPGTLVIRNTLTFKSDGTYNCDLSLTKSKADQVVCKGVTIESGAQFALNAQGNQTLANGTVFTVLENKTRQHISGTFANLPDHSTFSANGNNLAVSYEGGDGNDLTLAVVP